MYTSTASVTVSEPVTSTATPLALTRSALTASAPDPEVQLGPVAPVQASTGIILNGQNVSEAYGYNPDDIQGVLNLRLTGTALARAQNIVPQLAHTYMAQVTEGAVITFFWDGCSQPRIMYTSQASATATK